MIFELNVRYPSNRIYFFKSNLHRPPDVWNILLLKYQNEIQGWRAPAFKSSKEPSSFKDHSITVCNMLLRFPKRRVAEHAGDAEFQKVDTTFHHGKTRHP